jgi:TolB-like protein
VVQWTLGYLALAYTLLHGAEMLSEAFDWPHFVVRVFTLVLIVGVPVAAVLAWFHGSRAQRRVGGMEMTILVVLLLIGATLLWNTWKRPDRRAAESVAAIASVAEGGVSAISPQSLAVPAPSAPLAPAFNPPAHSIAVLPFTNMSGDKEQDYFSDGLSEELLNALARINELQVAARTSSFYFKGEHADLATIAHKLNVASVLEGSVRRAGHTIRVTAQLNNAVTGYQLWSQTYDRDLGDVLKLQADIANAVASALKVTLLGDVAAKIEIGGTRNPAAFDAYLRAANAYRRFGPVNLAAGGLNAEGLQSAITAYTEAIHADPDYALAYAGRSLAFADFARALVKGPEVGDYSSKAQLDAHKAITLAPDLADGHLALANFFAGSLELTGALQEYERALALAPGDARVLREYGAFAVLIGRSEAGLAASHRLLLLDPLNVTNHFGLGVSLTFARRYGDAIQAFRDTKALGQDDVSVNMWLGAAYYMSGDLQSARIACERAGELNGPWCLAMIYDKLGRHTEAEAMLAKVRAIGGDRFAEGYADIFAQWGDRARALDWLETAMRDRDPYLAYTKVNFFFDPLRNEPRFQAIERALKFPD